MSSISSRGLVAILTAPLHRVLQDVEQVLAVKAGLAEEPRMEPREQAASAAEARSTGGEKAPKGVIRGVRAARAPERVSETRVREAVERAEGPGLSRGVSTVPEGSEVQAPSPEASMGALPRLVLRRGMPVVSPPPLAPAPATPLVSVTAGMRGEGPEGTGTLRGVAMAPAQSPGGADERGERFMAAAPVFATSPSRAQDQAASREGGVAAPPPAPGESREQPTQVEAEREQSGIALRTMSRARERVEPIDAGAAAPASPPIEGAGAAPISAPAEKVGSSSVRGEPSQAPGSARPEAQTLPRLLLRRSPAPRPSPRVHLDVASAPGAGGLAPESVRLPPQVPAVASASSPASHPHEVGVPLVPREPRVVTVPVPMPEPVEGDLLRRELASHAPGAPLSSLPPGSPMPGATAASASTVSTPNIDREHFQEVLTDILQSAARAEGVEV